MKDEPDGTHRAHTSERTERTERTHINTLILNTSTRWLAVLAGGAS